MPGPLTLALASLVAFFAPAWLLDLIGIDEAWESGVVEYGGAVFLVLAAQAGFARARYPEALRAPSVQRYAGTAAALAMLFLVTSSGLFLLLALATLIGLSLNLLMVTTDHADMLRALRGGAAPGTGTAGR